VELSAEQGERERERAKERRKRKLIREIFVKRRKKRW
jgi:hypothetical protein